MSLKSVIESIVGVFKASPAGAAVVSIAQTDAQKLVAFLKTTTVGSAAIAAIKDASSSDLSGANKFEKVVADVLPVAVAYLTDRAGVTAETGAIEDVVRELVQSAFNDTLSVAKGVLARILAALGIA